MHLRRQKSGFGFRVLGGDEAGQPVNPETREKARMATGVEPRPSETPCPHASNRLCTLHPSCGSGVKPVPGSNRAFLIWQILIGAIIEKSPADLDGRLRPGDELLLVDGVPVVGKPHRYVIDLMHGAARNGQVNLVVRRRSQAAGEEEGAEPEMACVASPPSSHTHVCSCLCGDGLFPLWVPPPAGEPCPENGRSPGSVSTQHSSPRSDFTYAPPTSDRTPQPSDVVISRKESEGFGFVIISSLNRPEATAAAANSEFCSPVVGGRVSNLRPRGHVWPVEPDNAAQPLEG